MSRDPFDGVLDPFAWWDISATYEKYFGFFDLVIYCTIFIALAHVIFTKRFSGRAGKAMATAIGLALGISLTLAEQQFGMNLRQAGPIAVFIAMLLVGFLILHVLIRVHVSWKLAVPLTYVLMYLFARAMSPALWRAITDRVPFIDLLSAIIFLICVWQVGVALWPKSHGRHATKDSDSAFIATLDRKHEDREVKVEKRIKRKLAPEVKRETERIEKNLKGLLRELKRDSPRWKAIERALSDMGHSSDDELKAIDRIRTLDRRLRNFDWHELQQLSSYYRDLNEKDKERLKEQILLERRKIVQEHAIVELAERCEHRHRQIRQGLDQASRACSMEDLNGATHSISKVIQLEEEQKSDMGQLNRAEKKLLQLTRLKIKKEKG